MATFRYGITTDPCRTASSGKELLAEEFDKKGNLDPEKLLQCPFDKNHQIRACRFPYHIVKCKKNHPELARELKSCPYNARHLIPHHELKCHTEICEDRVSLASDCDKAADGQLKWKVPVSTWVNPKMSEDWDKEVDDAAAPFVWGVNTSQIRRLEERTANNLYLKSRVPNTLPWANQ